MIQKLLNKLYSEPRCERKGHSFQKRAITVIPPESVFHEGKWFVPYVYEACEWCDIAKGPDGELPKDITYSELGERAEAYYCEKEGWEECHAVIPSAEDLERGIKRLEKCNRQKNQEGEL